MTLGSVRHAEVLAAPAEEVWALIGDPAKIAGWFPDFADSSVEGRTRTITTTTGLEITEELIVVDPVLRRIEYVLNMPLVSEHRGCLDVLAVDDATCVVSYATDAAPRIMALVIAAPTHRALKHLAQHFGKEAS